MTSDPPDTPGGSPVPDAVVVPIGSELDLHTFRPKEVDGVVQAYLDACREHGLVEVRIIHGKGVGNLRRTVHSLLARHPDVESFASAAAAFGGMGATIVKLRPA